VLVIGVHAEALRAPVTYRNFNGISPIFDSLAGTENAVVACFPFPRQRESFANVDCMLVSTRFWLPLVNGYSSFIPDRYDREAKALDAFPEGDTLAYLRQLGVTHLIVFTNKLSPSRLQHLSERADVALWREDGSARIYVLK
jgi:hypothetical protein